MRPCVSVLGVLQHAVDDVAWAPACLGVSTCCSLAHFLCLCYRFKPLVSTPQTPRPAVVYNVSQQRVAPTACGKAAHQAQHSGAGQGCQSSMSLQQTRRFKSSVSSRQCCNHAIPRGSWRPRVSPPPQALHHQPLMHPRQRHALEQQAAGRCARMGWAAGAQCGEQGGVCGRGVSLQGLCGPRPLLL